MGNQSTNQVCSFAGGGIPSLVKIPVVSYSQSTFIAAKVGIGVCVCVSNGKIVQEKILTVSTTVGQHKFVSFLSRLFSKIS